MHVSATKEDNANHHLCGPDLQVYFYGVEVKGAVAANEEERWVQVYKYPATKLSGQELVNVSKLGENALEETILLHGDVRIFHPEKK